MGSTLNNCLGVLGGIPSLEEIFAYLNFRYLVAAFYRLGHPLRERLRVLNMGHCVGRYSDVLSLDLVPSESFTRHELPALLGTPVVDGHKEKKLANVQRAMYSLVAPREVLTVTSGYGPSCIFYTDGSLIEGCAGVVGFGYKIRGPAGVFTALRHVHEVIRPPERCLILTDSLSSIKAMLSRKIRHQTHPLVYECKKLCWSLYQKGIEVKLMWIPSHIDDRALEGTIFDIPLSSSDFQSLARPAFVRAWEAK
jgi:hypothetical protein